VTRTTAGRSRQGSCAGCLAWGAVPPQGLCRRCANFAARHRQTGECRSCGRGQSLKKGCCRLCWCQARLDRDQALSGPPASYGTLLPYVRQVRYHQLFFAGMPAPRDLVRPGGPGRPGTGPGSPGIARKQPPPAALRPHSPWVQQPLVTGLRRTYRYGIVDLRTDPVPANPWLAWALHVAHGAAQARGWDAAMLQTVNRVLVMLLASYAEPEVIRVSDFREVLRGRGNSIARTAEILTAMGILADDRPATFDTWLAAQLDGLSPGISAETGCWARAMHDGAPRTPP
jgi:hypothetical protein